MDIRQLQQFKAIVELGSFSSAAASMFISQPALTKSMQRLESELNIRLFDRAGTRAVLNEAGKKAYQRICQILEQVDGLNADLKEYIQPESISCCSDTGSSIIVNFLLPLFQVEYPIYPLCAKIVPKEEMKGETLLNGKEIILFSNMPILGKDVVNQLLFEDLAMIHIPVTSTLSGRAFVNIEELSGATFAIGNMDATMPTSMYQMFQRHNIKVTCIDLHNLLFYAYWMDKSDLFGFTTKGIFHFCNWPTRNALELRMEGKCVKIPFYASYLKKNHNLVCPLLEWLIKWSKDII